MWLVKFYVLVSEKAMASHSSTPAWKIPWMEEPGRLQSMGSLRVRHDWATSLSLFTFMHWGRKWQPTPVFLPGESLLSMGSHRVGHDWSDLAVAAISFSKGSFWPKDQIHVSCIGRWILYPWPIREVLSYAFLQNTLFSQTLDHLLYSALRCWGHRWANRGDIGAGRGGIRFVLEYFRPGEKETYQINRLI